MKKLKIDNNNFCVRLELFNSIEELIKHLSPKTRLNENSIKKVLAKNGIDGKSFSKSTVKKVAKSEKSNTDTNGTIDKEPKKRSN